MQRIFLYCLGAWMLVFLPISAHATAPVLHDADYYVLKAPHGEEWAAEDTELNKKLATLKKKFGTPLN